MLKIAGNSIQSDSLDGSYTSNSIEADIINKLSSSRETYQYSSLNQLKFELKLRVNIIEASRELDKSSFEFKIFKEAYCNPDYWILTKRGGFLLKDNAKPSDAIDDIFANSSKYGTECSTAIIIVYYRALTKLYPKELFDKAFANLQLMNWHYIDSDLDITTRENLADYLPGDCRYFDNPDVDPENPEWQGENTIDLGDGTYYGHGIGIRKASQIIKILNNHRKRRATVSASLLDAATNPNYKHLSTLYYNYLSEARCRYCRHYLEYKPWIS